MQQWQWINHLFICHFPSSVSSEHGSVAKTSGPGLIGKEAMARYQQLFNQLMDGEAANPEELDLEALDAGIDNLQLVATQSAADDKRRGPPSCPVKVVGDPEIVDCKGRYFHYLGPALLVNLDCRGMVSLLASKEVRKTATTSGRFGGTMSKPKNSSIETSETCKAIRHIASNAKMRGHGNYFMVMDGSVEVM